LGNVQEDVLLERTFSQANTKSSIAGLFAKVLRDFLVFIQTSINTEIKQIISSDWDLNCLFSKSITV